MTIRAVPQNKDRNWLGDIVCLESISSLAAVNRPEAILSR